MNDMTFVNNPNDLTTSSITSLLYDSEGREISENSDVFARIDFGESTRYFVLKEGTQLVDPIGQHALKRNSFKWSLQQVSKNCFESYLNYLKNKKQSSLSNAKRNMYDGSR